VPLSAYVDGEYVYGPDIPEENWVRLRTDRVEVRLPCGRPGFGRRSHLGTQHFVHRSRHAGCLWAHESAEHVEAKKLIVDAARACGWDVQTEQCGDDWRADVLAISPDHLRRVAFEVQLSPQNFETTSTRQRRYARDGIEGVWFFRQLPDSYSIWADMPMLKLIWDGTASVQVDMKPPRLGWTWPETQPVHYRRSLRAVVRAVLMQRLVARAFARILPEWIARIGVYLVVCSSCGRRTGVTGVSMPRVTPCGLPQGVMNVESSGSVSSTQSLHYDAFESFGSETQARVATALAAHDAPHIGGQRIEVRFCFQKSASRYRFACQWCMALLDSARVAGHQEPAVLVIDHPIPASPGDVRTIQLLHWCAVPDGEPCPETREAIVQNATYYPPTWPKGDIENIVKAECRRAGWMAEPSSPSELRWVATFWKKADCRIAFAIGAQQASEFAIRQAIAVCDDWGIRLYWFVEPEVLLASPRLRPYRVVPIERCRTADGLEVLAIDAGDGVFVDLSRGIQIFLRDAPATT
jgi:hypothetical protein